MDTPMFCFQCEQTMSDAGCHSLQGVCGKKASTANLQDDLTAALIGLAYATDGSELSAKQIKMILKGLLMTVTNTNFDDQTLQIFIDQVKAERDALLAHLHDEKIWTPYEMAELWADDEDIRSLKLFILFGIRGMAAYAYHAWVLGYQDTMVNNFFAEALEAVGANQSFAELLPLVLKTGEMNLKCMALLDQANTANYGIPEPTEVSLAVEPGPFIVISGHDLNDLELLLEQTKDKGISIYTHGEMLPAHAYPQLKGYSHLKGNFGTAWQNQQKEFAHLPGAVLFTSNCFMPVEESYADRVFTTAVVSYPNVTHIGEDKDFTPVIEKALALGGYTKPQRLTGVNGGEKMMTGYHHRPVLAMADEIVAAVKNGTIQHFFLVGGCDGARAGRNYYTEFVKKTPKNSLVFTMACGKYRFNDLDLGYIGSIPRMMDMGQCNDAYSAIQVVTTLAAAFDCEVNDLPLSIMLSWYEPKAVCILLTLLHLGIKNIYLGPTVPAFISPNVLNFLVEKFHIHPISTPQADLAKMLSS